jgi:hypothetical protein
MNGWTNVWLAWIACETMVIAIALCLLLEKMP